MANKKQSDDPVTPIYPSGPSTIPVDSVFRFIGLLRKYGQISEFRKAAAAENAVLTADPSTVRFIKDFVAAHPEMRQDRLGSRLLRPTAAEDRKATRSAKGAPREHGCNFG